MCADLSLSKNTLRGCVPILLNDSFYHVLNKILKLMNFKQLLYKVTLCAALLLVTGCEEHLTRPPLDQMTDETYWTNEENVRTFSWGFYPGFFTGYGSGFTWGAYFSGQSLNDDFAPTNPPQFTENVPTSGGGWGFANVRKANIFIDRVQGVDMAPEAVEHWT